MASILVNYKVHGEDILVRILKIFLTLIALGLSIEVFGTEKPKETLEKADKLYEQREDFDKAKQALSLFEKRLSSSPNDVGALWRASMGNYYIGHLLKEKKARIRYYKKGVEQGKKCVHLSKGKIVECYLWLGTNTALLKKEWGLISMAFGISDIMKTFEKVLILDPLYAGSGAYRMLALLHYKAPGFLGGDTRKAFSYIELAIKGSPNETLNYFLMLKFLVEEGKKDEALKKARGFIKRIDLNKVRFYESQKAHKKILKFIDTKKMPS